MAQSKKSPIEFNHTQDSAPEYVEVILWRRVVLALGTLVISLAGIGYLMFNLMNESGESDSLALHTSGGTGEIQADNNIPQDDSTNEHVVPQDSRIVPDQLAPTAAIPARQTRDETAAAEQLAQSIPAEPLPDDEVNAAKKPLQIAALDQPVAAAKKLVQTTSQSIQQATKQPTKAGDRHQVQTEIFFPDVKRAMLTTLIHNREPGKAVLSTTGMEQLNPVSLHQFIDIKGRAGDTLTYTWKHNGKIVSKTRVPVGADHWRNYASKAFHQNQHGKWEVEVTDSRNRLLVRTRFYLGA